MINASSNQTNPTNNPHYRSHATIISQVTLLGVLGVITILGNLASIVTFIKTQSLRRRSNYLIINLSVADLLVGIVDLKMMYFFLTGPQFNTFVFSLEILDTFTGMTSILILANIALERLSAISNPFGHRMLSFKLYVAVLVFPWVTSTAVCSLYLIAILSGPSLSEVLTSYFIIRPIVLALTLLIIVIAYIAIWVKSRQVNSSAQNQNRALRDRRLAVTLFVVTLASLLTWLPYECLQIAITYCTTCPLPHLNIVFVMKFIQFSNSGFNVFIYLTRMREFRAAFLLLFQCFHKPPTNKSTTTNTITRNFSDIASGTDDVNLSARINFGFGHRKSYMINESVIEGSMRSIDN